MTVGVMGLPLCKENSRTAYTLKALRSNSIKNG